MTFGLSGSTRLSCCRPGRPVLKGILRAERGSGLIPVDLAAICRELDELAWLLEQFPPEYVTFEDGDQSVREERVDDRIRVACRRIGKLIPSDVDAADCTFEQRGFLQGLRTPLADPVMLAAGPLQGF